MPTTIKLKNSVTTTAAPSSLVQGEVASNITDRKLWVGDASSTPVQILGAGAPVAGTTGTFTGNTTVAGTFSANGGATLGDASGDALTINSSAVSIPNGLNFDSNTLVIDAAGNRVLVGLSSAPASNNNIMFAGGLGGGPNILLYSNPTASQAATSGISVNTYGTGKFAGYSLSSNGNGVYANSGGAAQTYVASRASNILFGSLDNNPFENTSTTFTEQMRITSAGNVGIGITSTSGYKFKVSTSSTQGISVVTTNSTKGTPSLDMVDGSVDMVITPSAVDSVSYVGNYSNHPLVFNTNNTESMRITSAGNLGIGTQSPALGLVVEKDNGSGYVAGFRNASGSPILTIQNTGGVSQIQGLNSALSAVANIAMQLSGGNVGIGTASPAYRLQINASGGNGISLIGDTNNEASVLFGDSGSAAIGRLVYDNSTDSMRLWTNASERMRIDADGSIGIGTTTPNINTSGTVLHINNSTASRAAIIHMTNAESGSAAADGLICGKWSDGTNYFYDYDNNPIIFGTNNTIRMTILAGGNVQTQGQIDVGRGNNTTSALNAISIIRFAGGGSQYGMQFIPTANDTVAIYFSNAAGFGVGSISTTSTNTSYVTSSDYRLKENIAPMIGALDKVAALKPVTYTWKADGSNGEGFIAHELAEVCPDAVNGEKDALNEDGSIKAQGIDTSFLVATLTAAIQELNAKVTALEAQLENK